jgi:hypothetical protein
MDRRVESPSTESLTELDDLTNEDMEADLNT